MVWTPGDVSGLQTLTSNDHLHATHINELRTAVGQLVFNVKNYGAVGDGITDDIIAIQATVDACNAAGGGIVFFPPGIYLISNTVYYRGNAGVSSFNITLKGASRESTIIRLASGAATNTGTKVHAVVAGTYSLFTTPLVHQTGDLANTFDMFDLTLDYNGANQTLATIVYGLLLDNHGQRSLIQNCKFVNVFVPVLNFGTPTYGIALNNYDSQYAKIVNCIFDNCDLGLWLTTYAQGNPLQATVMGNQFYDTTNTSIYYESGQYATISGNLIQNPGHSGILGQVLTSTLNTNAVIEGNVVENAAVYGVLMQGNYNMIIGNIVDGSGYHGISSKGQHCLTVANNLSNVGNSSDGSIFRCGVHIEGDYNVISANAISAVNDHGIELLNVNYSTIVGNTILDAGQWANNTYSGINIENTSTHNIVTENVINAVASNKIKYGISEQSSSEDFNFAVGNRVFNAVTSSLHMLGTNSLPALLATGASHTVDDVITALQNLGLVRQS